MGMVYRAINKINGKSYIGYTVRSLETRRKCHIRDFLNGSTLVFHRALRKHGIDNFIWEELFESSSKRILKNIEVDFIVDLGTKIPNGYNMTDGGDGGSTPITDKGRMKISKFMKGKKKTTEHKNKISKSMKGHVITEAMKEADKQHSIRMTGRIVSDETKKKQSKAMKGKKKSKSHRENLSKALMGNNKGKTYEEMYGEEKASELRKNRGESNRKRKYSKETLEKMSKSQKGKKLTKEHKKNIGVSIRNSKLYQIAIQSPERGLKISESLKGNKRGSYKKKIITN